MVIKWQIRRCDVDGFCFQCFFCGVFILDMFVLTVVELITSMSVFRWNIFNLFRRLKKMFIPAKI